MADAPAVLGLINAAEAVDLGESMLEFTDIEVDWASAVFEIATDVVVVYDGDDLVAWAQICGDPALSGGDRADADVHPGERETRCVHHRGRCFQRVGGPRPPIVRGLAGAHDRSA